MNTNTAQADVPAGVQVVSVDGTYPNCAECIGAYPASACAGQYVYNAPVVYVRKSALGPDETIVFRYQDVCYEASGASGTFPVPPGAVILSPKNEYQDCNECVQGVVCELCPPVDETIDTTQAPTAWVPKTWLPDDVVFFKFQGWCFNCNPWQQTEPRPEEAFAVKPKAEYEDCADCNCGNALAKQGVQCLPCGYQADGFLAKDLWVEKDSLPADQIVFNYSNLCYFLNPAAMLSDIPSGATTINPGNQYSSCFDCVADRWDENDPDPENPDYAD